MQDHLAIGELLNTALVWYSDSHCIWFPTVQCIILPHLPSESFLPEQVRLAQGVARREEGEDRLVPSGSGLRHVQQTKMENKNGSKPVLLT